MGWFTSTEDFFWGNTDFGKNISDWQNNIDNHDPWDGYYIRVNKSTTLTVTGKPVSLPLTISLQAGWNIIGFPSQVPINALELLQPLIDMGMLE